MNTHVPAIGDLVEKYVTACITEAVEPVKADRDRLAIALAASEDELAAATAEHGVRAAADEATIRDYRAVIDEREGTIAQLRDTIDELLESTQSPDPEPVPERTMLGASPLVGGVSTKGRDSVVGRWGAGTVARLFASGGFAASPAPELGDAGRLLLSWKPDLSRPINEAECLAALQGAPAGSKVCVWHEPDVKARKGDAVAPMKARAAEFAAIVRKHRPDLDVMAVLSGWTFEPSTNYDPLAYIDRASFDVLGLDLDGLYGPQDYMPSIAKAQAWMRANGVTRYTVAEYGVKVRTSPSYTPAQREAWLTDQTTRILALEWLPEEICLFESNAYPEYTLGTAEQAAWRERIAVAHA